MAQIILASKSPRRRELLSKLGVDFECMDVDIDESWNGKETAMDHVVRLAKEKAQSARSMLADKHDVMIITADTIVVIGDDILGKPETEYEAYAMLEKLSGKTHTVYTAVCVINNSEKYLLNKSLVSFRSTTPDERKAYIDSGEPMDKAGAYAIQGKAAAYITRVEGSYSGIMGLPLRETLTLIEDANS
jgi:septum formation protein